MNPTQRCQYQDSFSIRSVACSCVTCALKNLCSCQFLLVVEAHLLQTIHRWSRFTLQVLVLLRRPAGFPLQSGLLFRLSIFVVSFIFPTPGRLPKHGKSSIKFLLLKSATQRCLLIVQSPGSKKILALIKTNYVFVIVSSRL